LQIRPIVHNPCKFQPVSRLGSVTARHYLVVGVSQTAALNTGRHIYSTGRPSRWALSHILVPCGFFLILLSSFFLRHNLSGRRLHVYHTRCGPSANLGFRSETCCTRLDENTRRKNDAKIAIGAPSHNVVGLLSSQLRAKARMDNREKLVKQQYLPHHALTIWRTLAHLRMRSVGDTPTNFSGFRVLAALLHGTLVVGVSQTAALNRGRHLYRGIDTRYSDIFTGGKR